MKCHKRNFPRINSLESYSLGVVDVAGILIPPTFNKLITLIPMLVPVSIKKKADTCVHFRASLVEAVTDICSVGS